MENIVNFYEGMDVDPADHNNLQVYAQNSLDHVVADGISTSQRYSGFAVAKNGVTGVIVDTGRLYSNGMRFVAAAPTSKDFLNSLPVAGKKIVSVVALGQTQDTDVRPREFLISEETGASEPRPVAMTKARVANVMFATGTEAPDPSPPLIDAGYTKIADILLTTTGVSQITMNAEALLSSVEGLSSRATSLEAFRNDANSKIVSLTSDLSKLALVMSGSASGLVLGRILERLADIEYKDKISPNAIDSQSDYGLTTELTDLTNPLSRTKVMEGFRFPDANASVSQLQVFNPLDPNVKIVGGVIFPAYTRQYFDTSGSITSELRVSALSYQTNKMVEKTMTRQRTRYGSEFTVCSNTTWFSTGKIDYATWTFQRNGETFEILGALTDNDPYRTGQIAHSTLRVRQVWVDDITEPYWDKVTVNHTVTGTQVAQSFFVGGDHWLDAVGLYFTRLAAAGDVTVDICKLSNSGTPDLSNVVSHTVVPRANLVLSPLGSRIETLIPVQPVFIQAGGKYAIVVTTSADHWIGMCDSDDPNTSMGPFFQLLDGGYAQSDVTKRMVFNRYRAVFNASRTVVNLNSLNLSGGILSIDVNADTIAPTNTLVTYEIQPSGTGAWYALTDPSSYMLGQSGSLTVLCGLRMILTGSTDMMPAVKASGSVVKISSPDTSFKHISKVRTLPVSSSTIHVIERLEGWDPVHHTTTVNIRSGAGYTTIKAPTSYTDVLSVDEYGQGVLERHYVFAMPSPVTTYQIETNGTTDTPRICFHVAWRKDYAL